MEDQVAKLNGILSDDGGSGSKDVAVFLGSGQKDPMAEQKALKGDYKLIYCTPEKLVSGGFLNSMANLHNSGEGDGLCLIAVDESHCVSEWGHDFRPSYRQVGNVLRGHAVLKNVPIVALTATAVPRVQTDILSSLQLRNPKVVKQSFDRDNLIITVRRKPAGGYRTALAGFVKDMKEMTTTTRKKMSFSRHESTIIYCPTQGQVVEVSNWLSQQFEGTDIRAQSYHGGQALEHRSDAHINFLTGKTAVIVATLAFGMGICKLVRSLSSGVVESSQNYYIVFFVLQYTYEDLTTNTPHLIDKTDTRRIIHYGPPKTVEEYYQQIGRAGRDGLEANCVMYCNSADFDKYKDDFYLGGLTADVRSNQEQSINSLRKFAMSEEACRRAELLKFFDEAPSFGERCGTCDTCVTRMTHSGDIERDFADNGARLMLYAISVLNGKQGIGNLEKVLQGSAVEAYRYRSQNMNPVAIKETVTLLKSKMTGYKKRVPVSYFTKDLLPALVSREYVEVLTQSSPAVNGRRGVSGLLLLISCLASVNHFLTLLKTQMSWSSYTLTTKGSSVLQTGPIVLPVPSSVRDYEKEQHEKLQKSLNELKKAGADVDQIPKHELEEGDGTVFKALRTWYNYLDLLQRTERTDRIDQLEDLRLRIDAWRMDVAVNYRIAPADAMPDHL